MVFKRVNQLRKGSGTRRLAVATALLAPLSVCLAQSQEVPVQDSNKLEEIVVTAQRREESLDKVAVSVTAFSQKTMDELHVQTLQDLGSVVPGLVLSTVGPGVAQSNTDIAIRGIFSGGNSPTTGIYIDETPIAVRQNTAAGFSGSPHPDIFDLDRIEVLRGPQGTLFGSGAMGGVVRFITPQPDLEKPSGYAKAEFMYTERGAPGYDMGVAYGAPVVDGVAGFRVSGWFHSDGGYIDIENPYTGEIQKRNANSSNAYTLRPAFTVVPIDGLTVTPAVYIQHQHSQEPPEYWVTELPYVENGAFASGFGSKINQPVNDDLTVPSLAVKYEFAGLALQSDTSYLDRSYNDFDDWSNFLGAFLGAPPLAPELADFTAYDKNIVWTKAWQQELRLSSQDSASRINWVAGAYYRHALDGVEQVIAPNLDPLTEYLYGATSEEAFGVPDMVINGTAYNSYARFKTVTVQEALFGEVTVNIVGGLKANVGLRVEHSSVQDQEQQYGGPLQGVTYAQVVLPNQEQTPITPRFGLTYQYTDNDMVYATAAKGYRPGGSNSPNATQNPLCAPSFEALGLTSVPTTYDSDSIWSYEAGAKDSLFDQRLSLQSSVYFIDWTGIQTQVNLLSCGAFYTANRGKAISKGFDFQVAGVVLDGLKVSANVGYTDAYYPHASYGAPVDGVTPILNAAGDKLHNVLPWTASAHLDYSVDTSRYLGDSRSYFRLDYRWFDAAPKYNPVIANYDPMVDSRTNAAYATLNLRMGVLRGGVDVSAFVENAANAHPLLGLNHASVDDPLLSATAIRPRTMGLTALYRF